MVARVKNNDVPSAQIVAVVTLRLISSSGAEVREVAVRVFRMVLVVSRYRPGSFLVTTPGWIVALLILFKRSVFVNVVPCRKDDDLSRCAGYNSIEKPSR